MTDRDRDYYARRVTQAREAARNASDPSIKALHLTLAIEYEAKLEHKSDSPGVRSSSHTP